MQAGKDLMNVRNGYVFDDVTNYAPYFHYVDIFLEMYVCINVY